MNITIRQIEIFVAIAEHGNVTRASENLMLSQSAASMALAEFENQIGQKLFNRCGKKLSLNESGRRVFPKASELLSRVEEIGGMFTQKSSVLAGAINVGASSTIGNYLITSYLGRFSEIYSKVEFSLEVGNTDRIISSLLDFSIDIGYIEGLCHHAKVKTIPWRKDRLIIFASPEHPLVRKKKLSPKDLESAKWILRERGSGTRDRFENAIAGKIINLNIGFEFGNTEAIKHAVKNNLGISCLSVLTISELLRNNEVIELETPFLDLMRNFYCLIHKEKYQTSALKEFIGYMNMQNNC